MDTYCWARSLFIGDGGRIAERDGTVTYACGDVGRTGY
jgi:hypothetical protein